MMEDSIQHPTQHNTQQRNTQHITTQPQQYIPNNDYVDEEALRTFVNNVKIGETVDCSPWRYIIERASINGDIICDWTSLRKLFCIEFMNSLQKLVREDVQSNRNISYEYEGHNLPMRRTRVLLQISRWNSPPFSTQRIAEILFDQHRIPESQRWYKTGNSFLHAMSRCVIGITPGLYDVEENLPQISPVDAGVIYFNSRGEPIQLMNDYNDKIALLTLSRNPAISSTILSKTLSNPATPNRTPIHTPLHTPVQTPMQTPMPTPKRNSKFRDKLEDMYLDS